MPSIGFFELVMVGLGCLVGLSIPTATLVVAVLIYRKLQGIERALEQGE